MSDPQNNNLTLFYKNDPNLNTEMESRNLIDKSKKIHYLDIFDDIFNELPTINEDKFNKLPMNYQNVFNICNISKLPTEHIEDDIFNMSVHTGFNELPVSMDHTEHTEHNEDDIFNMSTHTAFNELPIHIDDDIFNTSTHTTFNESPTLTDDNIFDTTTNNSLVNDHIDENTESPVNNELDDDSDWTMIDSDILDNKHRELVIYDTKRADEDDFVVECRELAIIDNSWFAMSSNFVYVAKVFGSTLFYTATSSIGRKTIFASALYFAGGVIVSTIGLVPTTMIAGLLWAL